MEKTHVCNVCQKRFVTKAALAQHKRVAHAAPVAAPKKAPRRRVRARKSNQVSTGDSGFVQSGVDVLTTTPIRVETSSRVVPTGTKVMELEVNPASLGLRLKAMSTLWASWKPTSLKLELQTSAGMTLFGALAYGWSPDPLFSLSGQADDVKKIMALRGSKFVNLGERSQMIIPLTSDRPWYHVKGVTQESSHGKLLCVVASPVSGASGTVNVLATLRWGFRFRGNEMPAFTPAQEVITPDQGWSNLFTTSSSDISSTRLTFKAHSGGGYVPFSAAKTGIVYTTNANTKVLYFDSAGAEKSCAYFVRYSDEKAALMLFATSSDAEDFVRTGNVDKAIAYNKAGNYTTPEIPTFQRYSKQRSTVDSEEAQTELSEIKARLDRLTYALERLQMQLDTGSEVSILEAPEEEPENCQPSENNPPSSS